MIGPNFMDEIDCGSFFDHIDDLLEFPPEDVSGGLMGGDCNSFPSIWTNASDPLPGPDSVFSGPNSNSNSDLSAELSVPTFNSFLVSMNVLACTSVCLFASIVGSSETFVPFLIGVLSIVLQYEDIVQLEWLSNFVEDSFSGGSIGLNKEDGSIVKDSPHHQFQTSSPVSVLESSSSCSGGGGKTIPLSPNHRGAQRARSKRPRPATFNPRPAIQLISPTSSVTESPQPILVPKASSDSENYAESSPLKKMPKPAAAEHKKKKKMKLSLPLGPVEMNQNPPAQAVRKCMHCEITKTPQWRAGPMGPKTLCNACGVRYKSGRLFPEYRPAASPTFVPALHSNSHKKVIEMRNKACENTAMTASAPTGTTSPPELIPNSSVSLDYM
ncbi:GATA transcription factor 8 [Vitis vinifera]|uniref:GATA transcription factor n=1 Tax=Vitis vinifera TaxID=29760 RepID=A0A438D9L5_VITVI|nr:GATA transcription factor 8 [Vitis vinifera]